MVNASERPDASKMQSSHCDEGQIPCVNAVAVVLETNSSQVADGKSSHLEARDDPCEERLGANKGPVDGNRLCVWYGVSRDVTPHAAKEGSKVAQATGVHEIRVVKLPRDPKIIQRRM